MKTLSLLTFLLLSISIFGQSSLPLSKHPDYINAKAAYNSSDFQTTINLGKKIIDNYYLKADLYALIGKAYLYLGKYPEASHYLKLAHDLEPIYDEIIFFTIVSSAYNKEPLNIKKVYNEFSFYGLAPSTFDYNNNYIDKLKSHFTSSPDYNTTIQELTNAKNKYNLDYPVNAMIFTKEAVELYLLPTKNKGEIDVSTVTEKLFSLKERLKDNSFPLSFYHQLLFYVASHAINDDNILKIEEELFEQFKNPNTSIMMRYKFFNMLSDVYQLKRQYDAEISLSNIMFDDITKISMSTSMNVRVLNSKMFALNNQSKFKEALSVAKIIEPVLDEIKDPDVLLLAYLQISIAHSNSGGKEKGLRLAEKAEIISNRLGAQNSEIGMEITRNLLRAKEMNGEVTVMNYDLTSTDFLSLYNDGVHLAISRKYDEAIQYFEKSKGIYEGFLESGTEKERSESLLFYAKIGGYLVACYYETKQHEKMFNVMESLKANSLVSKNKAKKAKLISLTELQQTLKNDEALVYYTDVSRGTTREGTYVAAVITKDSFHPQLIVSHGALMTTYVKYNRLIGEIESEMAKREFRKPNYTVYNNIEEAGFEEFRKGEVALLVELYRNLLNPYEGGELDPRFQNEMDFGIVSNSFFIDYLSRLEPYFKSKKKLIFALDGMQNRIPFESLVDLNSIYMIEKYDIAYIPSGTVLKNIRDRKPNTYTKNVLAFGDAKYAKLQNDGMTITSVADIDRLKNQVHEWQKEGKPLDYAFATFSKEAMTYLKGAKNEVEFIGNEIPNSVTKMGDLMTENEFKRMEREGELKNYKAIHLSSHASVHPYIFDLSSIAFSVFPTPQGNEDGMLTVAELEKLDIKTDFMMLSACQTGLGKIVPGDGISGLNQAMLTAGANSTLSTLWSVSDYGSYVFTANLYHKIFNLGMDYKDAVNDVKRQFIKGTYDSEYFNGKEVRFWAPFIYTGK